MLRNEDRDISGFFGSASLSSRRVVGLAANEQEAYGNGRCAVIDPRPSPPLGVKLTGYRLLNMTTVFSFGTAKAILTYMGRSTAPTTLDWVAGTLLAVLLYWIGLYEQKNAGKLEWFFQVDLAPGFGHCSKRVVGGVLGTLFYVDSLFVTPPLVGLLGCLLLHQIDGHAPLHLNGFSIAVYSIGTSSSRILGMAMAVCDTLCGRLWTYGTAC
ncbi:hypothetical protein H4582DRAFT_620713 [Lactarius indigo]|nr:hypothetical protein H4582DRAFT_620713 [Lactarius indigo]